MQAYARGERHSGIMGPIAAGLGSEDMRQLADYYSGLEGLELAPAGERTAQAVERGQAIAQQGVPSKRIPACIGCHGPSPIERNPAYPDLSGQYADYLVLQLELFKQDHRGGTEYAHIMQMVAANLTPEQMRDVAAYYASLAPGRNSE